MLYTWENAPTIIWGALLWDRASAAQHDVVSIVYRVMLLGMGVIQPPPNTCTRIHHGTHLGWDGVV